MSVARRGSLGSSGWATLGALVVWGLVHVVGGGMLMAADAVEGLRSLGPNVLATVPDAPGEAALALVRFHGLNIALGGLAVLVLALAWARSRRRWQLDVALGVTIALDLGLLIYLVGPGVMPLSQGLIGPVLVALALAGAVRARSAPSASVHA